MKKLLLFLFFTTVGLSQSTIDIRLVNSAVGSPVYVFNGGMPVSYESNDAGLNAVLSAYGVTNYQSSMGHPYPDYQFKTISIHGTYPSGLITDLNNYSSVIASARVSVDGNYTDAVRSQLLNAGVGSPTGVNSGIIVTSDTGLNTIFQNHNVFYYTQSYPSAPIGHALLRYYDVVCDCDKNLLKAALDAYTTVIQSTENISGALLSNNQHEHTQAAISPNPFSDSFDIQTAEIITNYSLFDVSGKQLMNSNSKSALDNVSSQITAGVYFLNLQFENGQQSNYKVVKK